MIEYFTTWLEQTQLARLIAGSLMLTASLSAVHLLGFTLVTGGALVSNLRLLGVILAQRPVIEVARPASIGIALGLLVSVATGLMLFSPRATVVIEAETFQLKMLLLLTAGFFHFTWHRSIVGREHASSVLVKLTGALGLSLWLGLAAAGCAFILLE